MASERQITPISYRLYEKVEKEEKLPKSICEAGRGLNTEYKECELLTNITCDSRCKLINKVSEKEIQQCIKTLMQHDKVV